MKVRSLKLVDRKYPKDFWEQKISNRWNYNDFLDHPEWGRDWISFDGVVHHAASDRVYCGLTRFDGDIFYYWDRATEHFKSLGFDQVMDKYDAKFHRGMELTADGSTLYLATALLHDVDRFYEAPGGGIYRHEIASGKTGKLGIPLPHNYIQSTLLDEEGGLLYNMHFAPECLSVFDLKTGTGRELGPISGGLQMAQGENLVRDDQGGIWCGWHASKAWHSCLGKDGARLCQYDPNTGKIVYFQHGLPRADGAQGFARVEGLFNLGTGKLFASGDNGSLYRIDPETAAVKYLGTPISDRRSRLTSLVMHPDGWAYGITGRDGQCQLLRFDPVKEKYELGDRIVDADGEAMCQCHDITVAADGVLFAGENDHPSRSSYLWEITL